MSRWSDVQSGRVDLVADFWDADLHRGWALFRVVIEADCLHDEEDDRVFTVRLRREEAERGIVRMECFLDIGEAIKRCQEWMKS